MIKTPYKLDLILNISDSQPQVKPQSISQISQISAYNSNISIHKNKIYDSETNLYQNKLKLIILNMGISDTLWLIEIVIKS